MAVQSAPFETSPHEVVDDYSVGFSRLRGRLANPRGGRYVDFVQSLSPDFGKVRRDIALGYAMLAASVLVALALPWLGAPGLVAALVGGTLIGYWIAYLQLFIHEGAHFNLAADPAASDRLCDRCISWLVGTTIEKYRKVHFQHHRALGTVRDSENSYFFPVNPAFIAKSLLAIRPIEVILGRARYLQQETGKKGKAEPGRSLNTLIALAFHGGIVAVAALSGLWWLALAWVFGVGMVFPFLGALRQALEHRDEGADPRQDYRRTDHGAYTRMFPSGPFSSTFGGAGFNRHLLHHWEPQVSYTNLPQLEAFLASTELATTIEARRATYGGAFLRLFSLR
jgi:fatty acid desaturase